VTEGEIWVIACERLHIFHCTNSAHPHSVNVASVVLWFEKIVCMYRDERTYFENPVMTFPINKRIDTEIFIDRVRDIPLCRQDMNLSCDQ